MKSWRRFFLLFFLLAGGSLLSPSSAFAQLNGWWAESQKSCESDGDDSAWPITDKEISFYEWHCKVLKTSKIADLSAWQKTLSCRFDKAPVTQTAIFMIDSARKLTVFIGKDTMYPKRIKCRRPPSWGR